MDSEGLSSVCGGLGYRRENEDGTLLRYEKGEYCLDNLKDLQRFLRRDDPHSREVFKQICKWNVVSRDLIPLMENHHTDRNLVINGVKILVFLTMPIDPTSNDIAQQIEYLWHIKAAITRQIIVGIIVSLLEDPLDHLERNTFTEDDWMLVQLVLTFFRNALAIQDILSQHKASGSSTHFLHLRDAFTEILFQENVMDLILVLTQNLNSSSRLRQDSMLFLEIFHYILRGHEPKLVAESSQEQSEDIVIENSLNSLRGIMEEEQKRARLLNLRNSAICSRFNGTFARLTADGSRTLCKGNPIAAYGKSLLQTPQVQRGPLKKIVWDKSLPPRSSKISSLLRNFLDQFLKGAYNVLMQSVIKDIEKDQYEVQNSDVIMFYRVACFVTEFQHRRISISKPEILTVPEEYSEDKEDHKSTFHGDICGPIAATMHETVFSLVLTKWRYAFETLKETSDYKLLSSSGAIMKSMIRLLDLVMKSSPEDSKEHQTARILLYKLFYDQTDQGTTQFLLSLIKSFDTHKQPKSDLADLVEIIYRFLKLMENLQQNGALRVSKKRRKGRKKKGSLGDKPAEEVKRPDDTHHADDAHHDDAMSCPTDDPPPTKDLNASNPDELTTALDSEILCSTKVSEEAGEQNYVTADSQDEHQPEMNEVDFCVSNVLIHLANNSIIQRLCWLLKFYSSNPSDVNYYVINLLQRIADDLELSPMLYQLSLLTIFYGILVDRKSSKCNEHQIVFDFLTKLVRRMFKKLKNQPLLFVELLLWKTRKECHYIDADSLLHEIHNLRKDAKNSEDGEEFSVAEMGGQHSRSIADSLGDDEATVLISDNLHHHNAETLVGSPQADRDDKPERSRDSVSPHGAIGESTAPSHGRKRIRAFSKDQEQTVRDLFEKFKDHKRCTHMIANALGPSACTSAQVARKLRQLGLRLPRTQKPKNDLVEDEKPEGSEEDEVMLSTLLKRCKKSKKNKREEGETGVDAIMGREEANSFDPSALSLSTVGTSPKEQKEEEEEQLESGWDEEMDDELADSGDELSFISPRNIGCRRKLRTVIDGDADD